MAEDGIDQRLGRIETALSTLATRDDISGLATKADVDAARADIAALQTKTEAIETELTLMTSGTPNCSPRSAMCAIRCSYKAASWCASSTATAPRTGRCLHCSSRSCAWSAGSSASNSAARGDMSSTYRRTWTGADGRVRWVASYRDQEGKRSATKAS